MTHERLQLILACVNVLAMILSLIAMFISRRSLKRTNKALGDIKKMTGESKP
jgi:hypothetical protein